MMGREGLACLDAANIQVSLGELILSTACLPARSRASLHIGEAIHWSYALSILSDMASSCDQGEDTAAAFPVSSSLFGDSSQYTEYQTTQWPDIAVEMMIRNLFVRSVA